MKLALTPDLKSYASHVLVIDDDLDLLRLLSMRLNAWGFRVSTAASAEEGLARIAVEAPQLVLSDIRLPGKDLAQLRKAAMAMHRGGVGYYPDSQFEALDHLRRMPRVVFDGPAGTGKTQMIKGLLAAEDPEELVYQPINFSFYTTSDVCYANMDAPLEKKTGVTFGPPGNRRLVYFLDDVNLPEVDKYGTQRAIELCRQQIEYEHM